MDVKTTTELIRVLRDKNVQSPDFYTSVMKTIENTEYAFINKQDEEKNTALHYAVQLFDKIDNVPMVLSIVKKILMKDARTDLQNNKYETFWDLLRKNKTGNYTDAFVYLVKNREHISKPYVEYTPKYDDKLILKTSFKMTNQSKPKNQRQPQKYSSFIINFPFKRKNISSIEPFYEDEEKDEEDEIIDIECKI